MSYPEKFWRGMDSPAEVVLYLAIRCLYPEMTIYDQVDLGPYRVDFLIPVFDVDDPLDAIAVPGVVVEVDGYSFHSSEDAFEADRRRDRALGLYAKSVVRFSAREVFEDPISCARSVQARIEIERCREIVSMDQIAIAAWACFMRGKALRHNTTDIATQRWCNIRSVLLGGES